MGTPGAFVRAYHLIITAYGFWLPNDPRGSWSTVVRSFELLKYGSATKTTEHRSLAYEPHDRAFRLAAKKALVRPPVKFNGLQAHAIARGIATSIKRSGFILHACAVMPDHAHFVVARHKYSIERVSAQLKSNASAQLAAEDLHPFQNQFHKDGTRPTPWARNEWSVFLSDDEAIVRAIRYVERNPIRANLKPQYWSFVTPFQP